MNRSGRRLRLEPIRRALELIAQENGAEGRSISVLITTRDELKELNQRFRGIDEATDVLTFPAPPVPSEEWGDIAIAIEFAEAMARRRRVALYQETAFLAIHGGLHLAGYDDENDADREEMIAEMNRVAESVGLRPDPDWSSLEHGEELA